MSTSHSQPADRAVTHIRREIPHMLRIAGPLVLGEIGWMSMGIVDTIMVGHLPNSAFAISAAALAQITFNTLAYGIGGVLLGLDTTIAQAHGAGKYPEANRWLAQGLLLAVGLSGFLIACFLLAPLGLARLQTDPAILAEAIKALYALTWGTLPLLLYFALRRYLQAFNHVRLIAATLLSANLVNAGFDWLLIYGHRWGSLTIPALGVEGSGLATSLARVYQAAFLIAAILYVNRKHAYGLLQASLRPDEASLRRLLALGLPSGAMILVEIAIFATITAVIATLGSISLAGHEIALNCISFTFMIPLGISAAASVRVGQAVGRRSLSEARSAGWSAIGIGAVFMSISSIVFLVLARPIASAFTRDQAVIAAAVPLLHIAALFQFCDGLQVTAVGALRGAGNTLSGLLTHLCSYWLIGLPLGLYLCFARHLGARGLWLGLCVALILSGAVLLYLWRRELRQLPLSA